MAKFSPGEIIPCEIVPGRNFTPPLGTLVFDSFGLSPQGTCLQVGFRVGLQFIVLWFIVWHVQHGSGSCDIPSQKR